MKWQVVYIGIWPLECRKVNIILAYKSWKTIEAFYWSYFVVGRLNGWYDNSWFKKTFESDLILLEQSGFMLGTTKEI